MTVAVDKVSANKAKELAKGAAAYQAYLQGETINMADVHAAVRYTLDKFGQKHPGRAVELRVPPVVAVQVLSGTTHRRGTPPAVVEMSPDIWLQLISGRLHWDEAYKSGKIDASGVQADLSKYLPDSEESVLLKAADVSDEVESAAQTREQRAAKTSALKINAKGAENSNEVDDIPHEECGVFGVYAPGEEVAKLAYFGLFALQHRGTESCGIATADGQKIVVYKDMGLVSQVFTNRDISSLKGHIAVGHVRYSTTGASRWENAQPTLGPTRTGTVALAHNGNLTNTKELREKVDAVVAAGNKTAAKTVRGATTDTVCVTALLGTIDGKLEESAPQILRQLTGAFSLVFAEENALHAARDPQGFRPLVIGKLAAGWVVASESAALDIVGATFVREVEPGEMITIDENGLRSQYFAESKRAGCIFEYVYLARPDTTISGRSVGAARSRMGKILARELPVDADLVIPTPDSGTPAAIGYAEESGIPFGMGLVKNAYVGRTFIQPTQAMRQMGIRLKLNPVREVIAGKRLVVIDDSIVRGNTQRALVKMLRDAGAKEVHVRISSPPVLWPCFFGIDFATRSELIANEQTTEEICASIGADTLGYISLDGMVEATGIKATDMCRACFTGEYPVKLPSDVQF